MKQRVISGIVIVLITILLVDVGNLLFKGFCLFAIGWGCKEFLDARSNIFNRNLYLVLVSNCLLLFYFFDYALYILIFEVLVLLVFAIFGITEKFDDISEAFLFTIIFGIGIHYFDYIESYSKALMGYIIIICFVGDAGAFFVGKFFGKTKLIEKISPNKTIEGALGGWIIATVISFIYSIIFSFFGLGFFRIFVLSILLPVVSQFGDLVFSMIKRFYNIKDFSDLIPGHGGLLDRLDSMLITALFYGLFISLF